MDSACWKPFGKGKKRFSALSDSRRDSWLRTPPFHRKVLLDTGLEYCLSQGVRRRGFFLLSHIDSRMEGGGAHDPGGGKRRKDSCMFYERTFRPFPLLTDFLCKRVSNPGKSMNPPGFRKVFPKKIKPSNFSALYTLLQVTASLNFFSNCIHFI